MLKILNWERKTCNQKVFDYYSADLSSTKFSHPEGHLYFQQNSSEWTKTDSLKLRHIRFGRKTPHFKVGTCTLYKSLWWSKSFRSLLDSECQFCMCLVFSPSCLLSVSPPPPTETLQTRFISENLVFTGRYAQVLQCRVL